ncbi:MAG: hypothetical protein KGP01_07005 [Actinomycetales bacterium]|nr:hypothetical protein [Actinomycetales bacterium]
MNQLRWLVIALLLATAAVFQSAFLPNTGLRMHTAVPVFLTVLALAQRVEFTAAVVIGGAAGLAVDLMPPATGPLGMNALLGVLAAAGMYGWTRLTATDTAGLAATLGVLIAAIAGLSLARSWASTVLVGHVPPAVVGRALARDCVVAALAAPLISPAVESLTRRRVSAWSGISAPGRRT